MTPTKIIKVLDPTVIEKHRHLQFLTDAGIMTKKEIQEATGMNSNTFALRAREEGGYLSDRFFRPVRKRTKGKGRRSCAVPGLIKKKKSQKSKPGTYAEKEREYLAALRRHYQLPEKDGQGSHV
jgi:hypothetical protein